MIQANDQLLVSQPFAVCKLRVRSCLKSYNPSFSATKYLDRDRQDSAKEKSRHPHKHQTNLA